MSSPRKAIAALGTSVLVLIVLAFHASCKRSPLSDSPAEAGASSAPVAAPPRAPVLAIDAGAVRRAPEFDALARELDARCVPKTPPRDNVEGKEAGARTAECMRRAFTADLDAVLVPMRDADPARFDALMKEQALWNKVVEDACWLAEEAGWVDFTEGTRDDGTARGTLLLACRQSAARERDWYARALAAADVADLNHRFEDRDAAGAASIGRVIFMRVGAHKLLQRGAPDAAIGFTFPRPLTMPERSEFEARARAVEDRIDDLAKATCANWPGLEAAAGGSARCRVKATRYTFAHFDFTGDFSGGGDP